MTFCSISKKLQRIFKNSFQVISEPSGALVTFIVDPYERSKDITCTTPCTIYIPWEPQRARHNKDKLLIQKDGYQSKVVPFRLGPRTMSKVILFVLALAALYFYKDYPSPVFFAYMLVMLSYSTGSDDLDVKLEPFENSHNNEKINTEE